MPITAQLAARPASHIAVRNYGVTDIPEGTAVIWDLVNVDPMKAQGIVVPAAAGAVAPAAGITADTIKAGGWGRLAVSDGEAVAVADGAIAMGDYVQISSTAAKMGRVKTLVAASGAQLGRAMNAAADGDPVVIELAIAKSA